MKYNLKIKGINHSLTFMQTDGTDAILKDQWKRKHLFPLKVLNNFTPELKLKYER